MGVQAYIIIDQYKGLYTTTIVQVSLLHLIILACLVQYGTGQIYIQVT